MPDDESEPWSAEKEFARGRADGRLPTVKREELRLAGMSLASVSNLPHSALPFDVSQAPGALLDYVAGSASQGYGGSGAHIAVSQML